MSSFNFVASSQTPADHPQCSQTHITVCCEDRWQVYHRLQELGISCQCGGFQPLKVDIQTVAEAIQLWSVVKRVSGSRHDLLTALTQSWQMPYKRTGSQR